METSCKELRRRAWNNLKNGNYWNAFCVSLLGGVIGTAAPFFLTGTMQVGVTAFYLDIAKGEKPDFQKMFCGFNFYLTTLLTYILGGIFLFLWSLLLVIPGIIKSLAYSQVFFIMAENPDMTPNDLITESRMAMKGYKWKYFKLNLSFIGWILLGALCFGLGTFFVAPYMMAASAEFYEELKLCHAVSHSE